jgi:FkbM family methyltransferase
VSLKKLLTTTIQSASDRLGYPVIPRWRLRRLDESSQLKDLLHLLSVDCVLDVGANVGQYHEFLRLHVGYTGHIVSFEPIAELFAGLERAARNDPKWTVHRLALGERDRAAAIHVMSERTLSSLLPRNEDSLREMGYEKYLRETETDRIEEVPVRRLDAIIDEVVPAGTTGIFLKSDTQGYDMAVIRGASGCLTRLMGIQIELPVREVYRGAPSYLEAIPELTALGFEVTGFVPVQRDATLRVINVDCLMIQGAEAERLHRERPAELVKAGRP